MQKSSVCLGIGLFFRRFPGVRDVSRIFSVNIVFLSRMLDGITSTSSSSLMKSMACSMGKITDGREVSVLRTD
jgi:hypothetical protein